MSVDVIRLGRQCWNGLPYLRKEIARDVSVLTGRVWTTPASYYIIYGGRCNVDCPFCYVDKNRQPEISGPDMLRLLREAKELSGSGFNISITGGEPLIYEPIFDLLAEAQRLHLNFGFTTNGYTMTPETARRVVAYDPFNINFSIESVDAKVNEVLRPKKDGTRLTLAGIENLIEAKRSARARVSIFVKATIMEQNFRHLPELVKFFSQWREVQVALQPFTGLPGSPFLVKDVGELRRVFDELLALRAAGCNLVADEETLNNFVEYFRRPPGQDGLRTLELNGNKRNCDVGLRTMFIFRDGAVHFCEYLGKPIGSIYQDSLKRIYFGAEADRQRRLMVTCNIDCQSTCKRRISLWTKARAFLKMG